MSFSVSVILISALVPGLIGVVLRKPVAIFGVLVCLLDSFLYGWFFGCVTSLIFSLVLTQLDNSPAAGPERPFQFWPTGGRTLTHTRKLNTAEQRLQTSSLRPVIRRQHWPSGQHGE